MDVKKQKHIAVVEASSKAELIRIINNAIDEYGINLIHYSIDASSKCNWQGDFTWTAELFFEGDMVFSYNFGDTEPQRKSDSDVWNR